ncbi:MAG TPA: tRNA pseudouridine(38-40) synthase TruA [Bacteroidetes bacterium]|nr:tRNA pseudouridine(38-40) synthase TruA [Bacteroidota bacterium]
MDINKIKNRYFIQLAFKGNRYHGWQLQPNAKTVQEELNNALSTLLKEDIETVGAGRTDAGVHARFYVAHFDSVREELARNDRFIYQLNGLLPDDIAVHAITPVPHTAHARYDALSRTYEYVITTQKDPFNLELAYFYQNNLDVTLMNRACRIIKHYRDFASFSKVNTDVKTFHCNIMDARWTQENHRYTFSIKADRFLRNMVRAIVGTLLDVGQQKTDLEKFRQIIETRDRSVAGRSVPAHGLFLVDIKYPAHIL